MKKIILAIVCVMIMLGAVSCGNSVSVVEEPEVEEPEVNKTPNNGSQVAVTEDVGEPEDKMESSNTPMNYYYDLKNISDEIRYTYASDRSADSYYCIVRNMSFTKEDFQYYTIIDDEKWFVADDEYQMVLMSAGACDATVNPMIVIPKDDIITTKNINLISENGEEKQFEVKWNVLKNPALISGHCLEYDVVNGVGNLKLMAPSYSQDGNKMGAGHEDEEMRFFSDLGGLLADNEFLIISMRGVNFGAKAYYDKWLECYKSNPNWKNQRLHLIIDTELSEEAAEFVKELAKLDNSIVYGSSDIFLDGKSIVDVWGKADECFANICGSIAAESEKQADLKSTSFSPKAAIADISLAEAVEKNAVQKNEQLGFADGYSEDLRTILAEVNAQHKSRFATRRSDVNTYNSRIQDDPKSAKLLTNEEIELMCKRTSTRQTDIEGARADVDLLFRALRASYGAYDYFGADNFDKARDNIFAWIDTKSGKISEADLSKKLAEELAFIYDYHLSLGTMWKKEITSVRSYHYFYSYQYRLGKEGDKFYSMINGDKWYFDSFDSDVVSLKKTVDSVGNIFYAPTQWIDDNRFVESCEMTLKNEAGNKNVTIIFDKDQVKTTENDVVRCDLNGDIAYVMHTTYASNNKKDFADTGVEAKSGKAVIFDVRGNGGGSSNNLEAFLDKLCGTPVRINYAAIMKRSKLYETANGSGSGSERVEYGCYARDVFTPNWVNNKKPILVLIDSNVCSSGEWGYLYSQSIDNTVSIGSNTAGCGLCGNVTDYWLPNTGMSVVWGSKLFYEDREFEDFRGWEPDLWCISKDADKAAKILLSDYFAE